MPLVILLFTIILIAGLAALLMRRSGFVASWPDYLKYPAVIILLPGIWLSSYALGNIQTGWQMKTWPATTATVIKSEVAGSRAFHPEITYRYTISGQIFESTTDLHISGFGGKRSRRDTAAKIIADFPPGTSVTIHYNSENPGESFLRSGPFWSDYMQLSLGLTLTSIGLIILFSLLFRRSISA